MYWVIRTLDGDIHYQSEAATIDEACEQMAQSVGYLSYADLCKDLGYSGANFEATQVLTEPKPTEINTRPAVIKRMAETAVRAFKVSRRQRYRSRS